MLHRNAYWAAAVGAAASLTAVPASATVTLPHLISDGMVLQQKTPVRIYGTTTPGEKVTVTLASQTGSATADPEGNWTVTLKPLAAGGPYTLNVSGTNTLSIKDVMVGEVWVCSGQSNMEMGMGALGTDDARKDIAASTDPQLRMFTVPKGIKYGPQKDISGGQWQSAAPQATPGFSAVAYYFGKALRKARNVPIGLIHTSWGGTRIEAWTDKNVLMAAGMPATEFRSPDPNDPTMRAAVAQWKSRVEKWKVAGSPTGPFVDPGIPSAAAGWEQAETDDAGWSTIRVPGAWEQSGIAELADLDGAVWFRKTIEIPASAAGKAAALSLGAIDDFDFTYVNGVKVGQIGAETPNFYSAPRKYTVPAGLLKPGKNVIAVRVWDGQGAGGMTGPAPEMHLTPSGGTAIALNGEWRYKIENGRPGDPGPEPSAGSDPNAASVLYNAMLYPLRQYTIAGALWYQGESNAGNPEAYRKQLPQMITNWRRDFGVGDFPFLVVQLAPFMAIQPQPTDTNWARLRESQNDATLALKNVGVAVINDVGDEKDIHPRRKGPVGERLALLARKIAYGEKIVAEGPKYKEMKAEGGKVVLTFDSVGGGLEARPTDSTGKAVPPGTVVGFAVAGSDGKFVWANAQVSGKDTITVSAPQVPEPKVVRFGWADFPVVNLYNSVGLPAGPFRTDHPEKR